MTTDPASNIPQVNSPAESWIQWHEDLKSYFGSKVANSLFVETWVIRGNSKANTSDLRKYLNDNGIKISESSWDSVVDKGVGALDFAGDIFKVGKYAGLAIGGIIILGAFALVWGIVKDPAKSVGRTIKYAI